MVMLLPNIIIKTLCIMCLNLTVIKYNHFNPIFQPLAFHLSVFYLRYYNLFTPLNNSPAFIAACSSHATKNITHLISSIGCKYTGKTA